MEAIALEVQKRDITGKQVKQIRNQDQVPGVVYGGGSKPRNVAVAYGVFEKFYRKAGDSSLIDLKVGDDSPVKVLVQEVQEDPIYGRYTHIDFRQVNMKEEIETTIELVFEGEAPAVKSKGGILVRNMDTVLVRCLPSALVSEIKIDLSALAEFGDGIRVKDLNIPEGMQIMTDGNDSIVVVNEPISEEELAELDEAPVEDVAAIEAEGEEEEGEEAAASDDTAKAE